MPEAEQGMNVARVASFRAGLPSPSPAMTINRYCASGLQSIALAADRIRGGSADAIVAGGTESMSYVPFGGNKISVNPWLVDNYPGSYMSMGLTAERVAKHYGISREQMDQFSFESHQKALAAIQSGKFDDEIVPVTVTSTPTPNGKGKAKPVESTFKQDEGPRADTSLEALAKLKPVFHATGTVTAGNSSQTSDGAAAAVVMSAERAAQLGIVPMAKFIAFAYAGCDPEEMGIGPIHAIPKALKTRRTNTRPDRPHRTERGLRRTVARRHQGARHRSRKAERKRRCYCPRASARLYWSQAHGNPAPRDAPS